MRTVALETTHTTGSIALLDGQQVIADVSLDPDRRSAQTLVSSLRSTLDQHGWVPQQIELVAVATGPGSFTGLRVGVTAAKTLAYAVKAEIVGINTLRAIAAATPPQFQRLWAAIDAQRCRVFAARFARRGDQLTEIRSTAVLPNDDWLDQIEPDDAVSGPILDQLAPRIPGFATVVDRSLWLPRAAWVGRLAVADFVAGHRDDLWQMVPCYYQPSAAEEKHAEEKRAEGIQAEEKRNEGIQAEGMQAAAMQAAAMQDEVKQAEERQDVEKRNEAADRGT